MSSGGGTLARALALVNYPSHKRLQWHK